MATIDYKEKYEQALERARQFVEKPYLEDSAGIVKYIFPEFAESEDERIRKSIIELLNEVHFTFKYYDINKMLAWLEKQSKDSSVLSNSSNIGKDEQKPAWKPTDEQMEYLAKAITTLGDEGNCKTASILNDLRFELKKLRGE